MMRRALLFLVLSAVLAASSCVSHGQAAVPLGVRIPRIQMAAPGRVRFDVTITGLQPERQPTIKVTAALSGQTIEALSLPVNAPRIPGFLDLPAGRIRIGGDASIGEFTPVPPLEENMPVAIEVAVRQGGAVATARQTGVLLLPTIIAPGYLNDMSGKPDPEILSVLTQRGYRATGGSPSVFWFTYNSRGLSLGQAGRALAAYVREVVLPRTYAARINVVGYSLGGLLTRWNLVFEPGWDHLVNRFVMVGVPNEGVVMSYVNGWYPLASPWARTPAARNLLPTFPFWRPAPRAAWGFPPDAWNPALAELNTHPLPEGIRAYAFYGTGARTEVGITGRLPEAGFSYGPGDGIVLAGSALGLPVNGGVGVPGLADRFVMQVDLGGVRHRGLLGAAIRKIVDVLIGRGVAERIGPPREGEERARTAQSAVTDGPELRGAGGQFLKTRGGR